MKRIKVLKAYFVIWLFILFIVYANFEILSTFFMATVVFSSAIVGLLLVGTLYQLISGYGIVMLGGTFGALAYKKTGYEFYLRSIDKILPANIAHMLYSRKNQQKMLFTQDESRNIVDWLEDKFHKQKSYINFFINTSMLIGLLGTFVGLVESIDEMGQIILSLNGDVNIQKIMQDFSGPLTGMAIGFGASLFGVVSAVILGINGYILFRYQDTLIDGIEDWLKDRIIDIVPESLGTSSQGTTALPEQRKSFMDIFIEQMDNFTVEMSKISQSNNGITVMADSITSIKHLMESEQTSLRTMLEQQERHYARFQTFADTLASSYETMNKQLSDERALLYSVLQNNTKVLERSDTALQSIDVSISSVDKKLDTQKETMNSMLLLGDKVAKEQERMHVELVDAVGALGNAVSHETQVLSGFVTSHEEKSQKISHILGEISSSSHVIEQKLEKENQALSSMVSMQERQYELSDKSASEMYAAVSAMHENIKNQVVNFENFAASQDGSNKKTAYTHTQMVELLESMSEAMSKEQGTLSSMLNTQSDIKQENHKHFNEAISTISELNRYFNVVKLSVDTVIKNQTENSSKQTRFNDALNISVERMNEHLAVGRERSDKIANFSEDAITVQKEGFERVSENLTKLASELSRIELKVAEYSDEHKEMQTNTLKVQDDRQEALMGELSSRAEATQTSLEDISSSLKGIDEKIGNFDASTLSSSGKKGFLSSLFGKN